VNVHAAVETDAARIEVQPRPRAGVVVRMDVLLDHRPQGLNASGLADVRRRRGAIGRQNANFIRSPRTIRATGR